MIPTINNQYNLNFRSIKLSAEETKRAAKGIETLKSSLSPKQKQIIKNDLFDVFNKHLKREVAIKKRNTHIYKDVLAELYLYFSELLNNIQNNPTLEIIVEKLNKYNPSDDTFKPEYVNESLDYKIGKDGFTETKADRITEENLPVPKSAIEKEKETEQLNSLINKANLSDVISRRIQKRIEGQTLKAIAKEEQVDVRTISESLRKGILRVKKSIDNMPPEYIEKAKELATIFGCTEEKAIKIISLHTDFLSKKTKTMLHNIKRTAELLECTEKELIDAGLKQPTIFGMKPETILQSIEKKAQALKCEKKKLIQLALKKQPALFFLRNETLENTIKGSSNIIGCTEQEFITLAFKEPTLFYMKPETIQKNIQESTTLLKCTKEDFIHAVMKQPSLLYYQPKTLKNNVDKSSKLLKCSVESFINAALKTGSLLYQKPETLKKNVHMSAKMLGITEEEFIKMALRHPPLLCLKPETIKHNAEEMAKVLNISVKEYVKQISGSPTILSQKPETLKKKIEINNYFQKIKNEQPKINLLQCSDDKLYSRILAYLIQQLKDKKLEQYVKVRRNFDLTTFIKANSDRKFSFEIPADEVAEDFVNFVQETSVKTIGKNIFKFKITGTDVK